MLAAIGLLLGALVLALLSGHQRISLNASLSNWTLAWFYVPPLVLLAFWLASRRQAASERGEVAKPSDTPE